jgi:hypothetical protein
MGKFSTARQERAQKSREREASLETIRNPSREAVPADLDRLIHERIRLGIVSALAVNRSLTFNELKALLKTTDGNLSVHARKLEEADSSFARNPLTGACRRRSTAWQWRGAKRSSAI